MRFEVGIIHIKDFRATMLDYVHALPHLALLARARVNVCVCVCVCVCVIV